MKYIQRLKSMTILLTIIMMSHYVYPFDDNHKGVKNSASILAAPSSSKLHPMASGFAYFSDNGFRGNPAYGHNAWTYEIFSLDVDDPTTINILDTVDFQTFCGDFEPGNDQQFWLIQYPENILKTFNVVSGESQFQADLPVPLTDGVWSSLSVHKTTGDFYAIATNGFQSIIYSVDKSSGSTQQLFNLGLPAVISSAFDGSGTFYVFDIETDSTYTLDLSLGTVTGLGPAGFDGNYAQGMAYDPVGDAIYLSAYEDLVGPQLRKLNRQSGEALFLGNLPGETAAFSFPGMVNSIPEGLDFGDAPEVAGTLFSFPTTLANNGAAHVIHPDIFLGNKIDGEEDGQPDATAKGDDNDLLYPSMGDDEDGVELPQAFYQGVETSMNVTASVDGFLDVWMDFDLDQSWFNPAEHIFNQTQLYKGVNKLTFIVPPTAVEGLSFMRFRFRDYAQPLSFDGMANNGEVEDYMLEIKESTSENFDFGDAPQGYGNFNYKTTFIENGARHTVVAGIYLGSFADTEPDGQPAGNALGDDNNLFYPSQGDDEDGVELPESVAPGETSTFVVTASVNGFLDAWIDFDQNGNWDGTNEHIFNSYAVSVGPNNLSVTIPASAVPGNTYLRFRFRNNNTPLSWYGPAENGEVEDYALQISEQTGTGMDFGDAPEGFSTGSYPTLLAHDGARHIIVPGINLGSKADAEPNGQPSVNATGDDSDMMYPSQGDDEDGVVFSGPLVAGSNNSITVTASVAGFLNAWIDFNIDGNWNGSGEQIFNLEPLVAGSNTISFSVPDDAVSGVSFARFRFQSSSTSTSFDGLAEDGEVEDYAIQIQANSTTGWDFGDAPDDLYPTTLANNGARHYSDGITFLGSSIDTEPDAISSAIAKGDDLNNLDDEDGIMYQNAMLVGGFVSIEVLASVDGTLNAWIDFNKDNSWADSGEQIFTDRALTAGMNILSYLVPDWALTGETFMRFRFGSQTGLSFIGPATNGEVEDYMGTIYPAWNSNPTSLTHIISIPAGMSPLQMGDMLGVFFTDNDGSTKSAGAVVYNQGQFNQLIAFGDNPATPDIKEGLSIGETMSWKLFSSATSSTHDLEVIYDPLFPDHDGNFKPFGFSALLEMNYLENPCDMPQSWSYVVTGSSHNISIPLTSNPGIFGEPVNPGDWIGVFYTADNGDEACGGAVQWNGTTNLVVNAYGDDPLTSDKDGFTAGEVFNWKIYRCNSMETYSALAAYNSTLPCQGHFGNFCLSEITSLEALYLQNINLFTGWNSMSIYNVPLDTDVENIFEAYVDKLIIIKNLTSLYWPYSGVNSIGDWDNSSGYAIKVSDDISLQMTGLSFASKEIDFSAGWHYLPVLSECPVNADELFAPVMDKITLVQDIIGTKVWWPEMGVFTLEYLLPGKAYKIRLEDAITITFPDCDYKSYIETSSKQTQDSIWGKLKMTPSTQVTAVLQSALIGFMEGDIIGAFGLNDQLFGYLELNGQRQNLAITLFGDDATTVDQDGFEDGEAIAFKLFRTSTGESFNLDVDYDNSMENSTGTFQSGSLAAIINIEMKSSATGTLNSGSIEIYPNPANDELFIKLNNSESGMVLLTIMDATGQKIMGKTFTDKINLNVSSYASGIYFVKINGAQFNKIIKLVVK